MLRTPTATFVSHDAMLKKSLKVHGNSMQFHPASNHSTPPELNVIGRRSAITDRPLQYSAEAQVDQGNLSPHPLS
jgi:hypothetical protein